MHTELVLLSYFSLQPVPPPLLRYPPPTDPFPTEQMIVWECNKVLTWWCLVSCLSPRQVRWLVWGGQKEDMIRMWSKLLIAPHHILTVPWASQHSRKVASESGWVGGGGHQGRDDYVQKGEILGSYNIVDLLASYCLLMPVFYRVLYWIIVLWNTIT